MPGSEFTAAQKVAIERLVPEQAHRSVREMLRYWLRLRDSRPMPGFADLDPVDIPWALSRIFVVEIPPGSDPRYRLTGEEIAERYGCPMKGARVSDIMEPDSAAMIERRWHICADRRVGFFALTDHPSKTGVRVGGERLILPLSDDGRTVDHLLGYTYFVDGRAEFNEIHRRHDLRTMRWAEI